MSTTLDEILNQFREDARNNRELGDRFERLMVRYFELDPLYADRFSNIWMWNEWPAKGQVGDVGVDLVARERATGEYCAIQCKFYLPEHTISKADIDSFFTASGRKHFTSGIIVSTTDKWGKNAEDALEHQTKAFTRLGIHDLKASPIDWSVFDVRRPQDLKRVAKKSLREHQKNALKDVVDGLAKADRGKLIMACGTGKTFTALKIAESIAPAGHILFLVPSLSLLSQSLREWTAESDLGIYSLAVCSDPNIGKKRSTTNDSAEITIHDLPFPATTNVNELVQQFTQFKELAKSDLPRMTVVFSTYHSIGVIANAQKSGLPKFDLIICDEAHRTTGVTLTGEDESHFVKVHDGNFIKSRKRLYMTATPRIYGDAAKSKAKEASAELASMDDLHLFGEELHRLTFGEAVGKALLSDYKVLVLAVDEKYVAKTFQKQIADKNSELNLDDAVKITGCWNGLEKRFEAASTAVDLQGDTQPMRRAVAFSRSIKDSKAFVEKFSQIIAAYKETHPYADDLLDVEAEHVDGTFDALRRGALIDWLKADAPSMTCRVLSNAKCLSEGVDVPALDSVMFLNPRKSVIDVVQSVGRVMRRAEGKRYGYIILPIGIPADMKPEDALKNNEKYKVVWQVLQALRAHDDRFNATINQLELNEKRPANIQVIGLSGPDVTDNDGAAESTPKLRTIQGIFAFPQLEEWKDAIYAKIVLKCGDRAYWETWARDIAQITERHITRIKALLDNPNAKHATVFAEFLGGLQLNLNPAVTRDDAIEMLAQHLITKPVFDALFSHYAFTKANPVSQSMQRMLDLLQEQSLDKDATTLEKFYASVRDRAKGLDNAKARQKVVTELYDEFFRTAFPRMAERLGIVYTPVEVVDFIIRSVEDVLRNDFNSGLAEKDVHIIDPFTGTGTFLVRILQSGLIPDQKLLNKYKHELHANEIVLLAYYIAAINIEETFHGLPTNKGRDEYLPFEGICLTDTFQLYESSQGVIEGTFPENTARVKRQKASPIRVVIANPPYSANQGDANNNNQNLAYPALDARIGESYAARSTATNKNSLYDSYKRAIRWATDRVQGRGVIGIVTNGSFIDGNTDDGLRASLIDEFSSIYVFNLRGNANTSGEIRRREKGNVFGGGTKATIAITILVKNPESKAKCVIRYHDIGDYLDRDEKLKIISDFASIEGIELAQKWEIIQPNESNDWINQRDPKFELFVSIGDRSGDESITIFNAYSRGLETARDAWCYNFSSKELASNVQRHIDFYNEQVQEFATISADFTKEELPKKAAEFVDTDARKISWSRSFMRDLCGRKKYSYDPAAYHTAAYRPFCKMRAYVHREMNNVVGSMLKFFPNDSMKNVAIGVKQRWTGQGQIALLVDCIGDLQTDGGWQYFPLYLYESDDDSRRLEFEKDDRGGISGYHRRDAITDTILKTFREEYGANVSKEDIFYYVYGILHSPEYRTRFAADLKKMLPRIPCTTEVHDFVAFAVAGRRLAESHLNYEAVEPWPVKEFSDQLDLDPEEKFKVQKMVFGRPTPQQKAAGEKWDKTRIIYNGHIVLSNIPLEAYDYVVNGKSAIEWVIERYQVSRDPQSGIVNDPNDWCRERNQPRYIIDLLKRIVRVSIETMRIVRDLPPLNERRSKQFKQSTKAIVADVVEFVKNKHAEGWTRDDFAAGLQKMFESETGEVE